MSYGACTGYIGVSGTIQEKGSEKEWEIVNNEKFWKN
jgi:hypothetical protein